MDPLASTSPPEVRSDSVRTLGDFSNPDLNISPVALGLSSPRSKVFSALTADEATKSEQIKPGVSLSDLMRLHYGSADLPR